jgi:hypothetical protein
MKYYIYSFIGMFEETCILIIREDGAQFAMDETNSDYQAYLAWVAEGNSAEEWTGN